MGHTLHSFISFQGNILRLKDLGKTDRGVYRCIADNAVRPPAMFDTNLYVNFAPYAQAVQRSYGQAQNRLFDALLECRISGTVLCGHCNNYVRLFTDFFPYIY